MAKRKGKMAIKWKGRARKGWKDGWKPTIWTCYDRGGGGGVGGGGLVENKKNLGGRPWNSTSLEPGGRYLPSGICPRHLPISEKRVLYVD